MHARGSCKCLYCAEMFIPDARNRARQRCCGKPVCRKARKADSQRRWLGKPDNADYFTGPANSARSRAWQADHPESVAPQDVVVVLQDRMITQDTLIAGLISQLAGSVLQDDIAPLTRRLQSRGRAVLGLDVQRSVYGKPTQTPDPAPPTTARAAFV